MVVLINLSWAGFCRPKLKFITSSKLNLDIDLFLIILDLFIFLFEILFDSVFIDEF